MRTSFSKLLLSASIALFFISSCGGDDGENSPPIATATPEIFPTSTPAPSTPTPTSPPVTVVITTEELVITADENPEQSAFLGTVLGRTNIGNIEFLVSEQTPNGAIHINPTTGDISVAEPSLFDFEAHPTITAIVSLSNGDALEQTTVRIDLVDINESTNESMRSIYVNGFAEILGDTDRENQLLEYAQDHEMAVLILYDLHKIDIGSNVGDNRLANFISKAKTRYGVTHIAATSENADGFKNNIDPYNNRRNDPSEKIDIYNLEFEFWNVRPGSGAYNAYCEQYLIPLNLPCDIDGAFDFFIFVLQQMRTLAATNPHDITTEAYIGWTNKNLLMNEQEVAMSIAENLDRIRVHAYIQDPDDAWNYVSTRLDHLGDVNLGLDISIIFSAETQGVKGSNDTFMGPWLESNSMMEAENIVTQAFNGAAANITDGIRLEGFTYYNYTHNSEVELY